MTREGCNYEEIKDSVMEAVSEHFRPEFINRVDDLVVFHPLDADQIKKIAQLQLNILKNRLLEQEIEIEVSDAALGLIAEAGYDPVYGARPLKRVIQHRLENPLAQEILSGYYSSGDKIVIDKEGENLTIVKKS